MPFNIGIVELLVICVFGLLIFGRRLPEVMRSLGRSVVEFKKGMRGVEDEIRDEMDKVDDRASPPAGPPPNLNQNSGSPAEPTPAKDGEAVS